MTKWMVENADGLVIVCLMLIALGVLGVILDQFRKK